ncbi:MAG TPA: HD domain-containing protein [Campylobacterales bacterium]|nr:HD domain-containing protein [Campylobacterales bacterium]
MQEIKMEIESLLHENAPDFKIAKALKKEIKSYFDTLEERFTDVSGRNFLISHTKRIDTFLQLIHKVAMRSMFEDYMPLKNNVPVALVALGSYGRQQLCVYSDIDLMLVYKKVPGYNCEAFIEKILYILWDTGLKLGHRVHEVSELFEVSNTDITIKTSLIESRFIEGSKFVWTEVENELNRIRHHDRQHYIETKIQEIKSLHEKYPLTMEPNIKDGVGGFRNANLIYWVGNVLYNVQRIQQLPATIVEDKEYKEFHLALDFLFKVRSALHLCRGKKVDTLRLEFIPQIARYLGYNDTKAGHMRFAREVTASLKVIKLYTSIWLNALAPNIPMPPALKPESSKENFRSLLQQLLNAADHPFVVHPTFLKALSKIPVPVTLRDAHYPLIRQIFFKPHSHDILQTLLDAGLLKYAIPPLKQVINLPQFDGYHQYAVDIHTLRAIGYIENIEDVTLTAIYNTLKPEEQALLKLLVLLHDAGKGRREDHHVVGVRLFKEFAPKLKLSEEQIRIGKNIVLHHNEMSNVAQREDLHSEQVILKFAANFPSKLELDLIYLLTYADMSAVGKGIYNDFNKRLLLTLYRKSLTTISHGEKLYQTSKRLKKENNLKRFEAFQRLPKSFQKKILSIPADLLFIKYTLKKILAIAEEAKSLQNHSYRIANEGFLTIEILRKENLDVSYLLHKLDRLDIVQMDIFKLFDDIKYFKITFNETIDESERPLLEDILEEALTQTHRLTLTHPTIREEEIFIDCDHSEEHAIMKLCCVDQKGLLSYMIHIFDGMGIDISSAKIHTKMNRVNDLFLIQKNGNFCNNTSRIIKELTER